MAETDLATAWSTEQLLEFVTISSDFQSETDAAQGTVERMAEALDAEVVAIVAGGSVVASVGYPEGEAPIDELVAVAVGESRLLTIPGAGRFPATLASLEFPEGGTLVLARSWSDHLTRVETGALRGIARVAAINMRVLHLLALEREQQVLLKERADRQNALRRVATLVARGVDEPTLLRTVAEEIASLGNADVVQILRYEADGAAVRVAGMGPAAVELEIGERFPTGGHNVATIVRETGRPALIDDAAQVTGSPKPLSERLGVQSTCGCPIVVEDRLWGVVIASTTRSAPMPTDTERRISEFTELVATAISNAHARAELAASRARVVMASDATRRRIERDLHDGVQQRLVTLALEMRSAIEKAGPAEQGGLTRIEQGLQELLEEIREISRGLHPAILSEAGLTPALKTLARRSPLPVQLELQCEERAPVAIEVAAYYVISEALTNAAKHARASGARVTVRQAGDGLRIEIGDNGVGGADPRRGTGLIGLSDRVEALGGTVSVTSLPTEGTTIIAYFPVAH